MNSLDARYGYDANFISDVLDYLKCNVCHLVMREPVQIMTCGHRFCKPCFERLQGYSTHFVEYYRKIAMNSLDARYGYDANFISDVLDYLKCNVCHLVMREPVQIMTCGHRFCKPCFERLQGYSTHLSTQLRCPIDRDPIDIDKVFDDTAVSRDISNLQVTCSYATFGCPWKGDLRDLMDHEKECQHQINQNMQNQNQVANTENMNLVAELLKRVQNCENKLNAKEKDLVHMKDDILEMKKKYDEKENEVTALKTLNEEIHRELINAKKINEELKESFKQKVETIEKIETCLNSLETRTNEVFEQNKLIETKINANKTAIVESKNLFVSKKQIEIFKADITNQLELLESQIKTNETTIKDCKDKSASKNQLQNFERTITNKLNEEVNTSRKDLIRHLENTENIMFCHQPYCTEKNIKIKWVMTNFQRNYDSGERIFSPMFYTSLQGYCFKLFVKWWGKNREYIDLYLKICLNEDAPVEQDDEGKHVLQPFRIEFDLEVHDKNGSSKVHSVTFADLDGLREVCFTIPPNKNEANGFGTHCMLHKSTWNDYVINDMMYITCTFRT